MKNWKFSSFRFMKASLIDKDKLSVSLPHCVRIVNETNDEKKNIALVSKMQFNLLQQFILSEQGEAILFSYGQIMILVKELLKILPNFKQYKMNSQFIWLCFNADEPVRIERRSRKLNFNLFYCQPLRKENDDLSAFNSIVIELLQLCDKCKETKFWSFSKPHKELLLTLINKDNVGFQNAFNKYFKDNIILESQKDCNIDPDQFENTANLQREIDNKIIAETTKIYYFQPEVLTEYEIIHYLLMEYNLKNMVISGQIEGIILQHDVNTISHFNHKEPSIKMIELIKLTLDSQNLSLQQQFKLSVEFDEFIQGIYLKSLYENAIVRFAKQNGYFHSYEKFLELYDYLNTSQQEFDEKCYYLIEPTIREQYHQFIEMKVCDITQDLI